MEASRTVITLLIALIGVEVILLIVGSASSLSPIQHSVLMGFLFGLPTLLVGGLVLFRQRWIVMAAVMYGTIALALDLATIVQEAAQPSPEPSILALTVASSLLNFLIMIFGGHCVLSASTVERPPRGPHPNPRFPASS